MTRAGARLGCAVLAALLPVAADAADGFERGKKDVFLISLGGFLVDFDTEARVDSETLGLGTEINLEDDLGLDTDQTRIRLDGYWRFAPKHRLDFGSFVFNRRSERTIDRDLQFGDTLFPIDAEIESRSRQSMVKLGYKYSIWRNQRFEGGISAGFSTLITRAELSGQGSVSGGGFEFREESEDVIAPIPTLGLHAEWNAIGDLYLRGAAEYFHIGVDTWEGDVRDYRFSLDWYPLRHFGFGLGYNLFKIEWTDEDAPALEFQYRYDGGLLYLTYVF